MKTPARIVFAGTPEFALQSLRALHRAGHDIATVITRPDRAAGRGRKPAVSPVREWACGAGLEVLQPRDWRDAGPIRSLRELNAHLLVVAAYGAILPEPALAACRLGAVNVHASLLPRWRGASPVAAAILAGDAETGVTLMRMDPGLDTGPILAARPTRIRPDDTAGSLESRLATLGAGLLLEQLPAILAGELDAFEQDSSRATYASRITKQQGRLDWSKPAKALARCVRAFDPWPVAHARWRDRPLRLWGARALEGDAAEPGRVLGISDDGMDVATVAGILRVREVQLPGRRRMPAADAARGAPLAAALLA